MCIAFDISGTLDLQLFFAVVSVNSDLIAGVLSSVVLHFWLVKFSRLLLFLCNILFNILCHFLFSVIILSIDFVPAAFYLLLFMLFYVFLNLVQLL